jgi:hypothetical protein
MLHIMTNHKRLGVLGALLQSIYFIVVPLFSLVIIPSQGIAATTGGLYNPSAGLAYASSSPTLALFQLSGLYMVVGLVLVVPILYDRLHPSSPGIMRTATLAGLLSAFLFSASVAIGFLIFPLLTGLSANYPVETRTTYLTVILISGAFVRGAIFAYGWWVTLSSWAAFRAGAFSRAFNFVGIAAGITSMLAFFVASISLVSVLADLVWSIWLAGVLLRAGRSQAH